MIFLGISAALALGFWLLKDFAEARAAAEFKRDLASLGENLPTEGGERVPVLVELFTSEGCSSCPPADTLLMQLDQLQPVAGAEVIVLSEHVDYWNYIGWKDPFSSPLFSRRQEIYSSVFGGDSIYTPQMVVDGEREFVGSRVSQARQEIAKAAEQKKAVVTLKPLQNKAQEIQLAINIDRLPRFQTGDKAEVLLAIAESNLNSSVSRGENSGRKLVHTAVVRKLETVGQIDGAKDQFATTQSVNLEKAWQRENLKIVVFVQARTSRKILGVASLKI
jgi:hypothetical protein